VPRWARSSGTPTTGWRHS